MSLTPVTQVQSLTHCDVRPSLFDSLVTDQFLRHVPIEEIDGSCVSYPRIKEADKPTTIAYVSSGGTVNDTPVSYDATAMDYALKRIVSQVTVAGDIFENVSDINDVMEDQALAMAQLVVQKVGEQLWNPTVGADDPANMVTFAATNPMGVGQPVQGADAPIKLPDDLLCLRGRRWPWNPSTPQYYVMNSGMYYEIMQQAWSTGTNLVEFRRDEASGETMPHMLGVPVLITDHITGDESGTGTSSIYMVQLGRGPHDPEKIDGVRMITPSRWPGIEISPAATNDGTDDEFNLKVSWNLAFSMGSAMSVARTERFEYPG